MQLYKDSNGKVYSYENDVTIKTDSSGNTIGIAPDGSQLPNVPKSLTSYTPSTADKLAAAKQAQIAQLNQSYKAAIDADIKFTNAAGTQKMYQAGPTSRARLQETINGYSKSGSVPSGFYWLSKDNTQVSFTYADLQNLAQALTDRGNKAFQKLQTKKANVRAVTTSTSNPIQTVQGITW